MTARRRVLDPIVAAPAPSSSKAAEIGRRPEGPARSRRFAFEQLATFEQHSVGKKLRAAGQADDARSGDPLFMGRDPRTRVANPYEPRQMPRARPAIASLTRFSRRAELGDLTAPAGPPGLGHRPTRPYGTRIGEKKGAAAALPQGLVETLKDPFRRWRVGYRHQ